MIPQTILYILAGWILLTIVLPFLILPNYLFKTKIQHTQKIKKLANKLKRKTKEETLKNIFNYVIKNYGGRKEFYKLFYVPKLFYYNVEKLLNKKQVLSCQTHSHLLATLLLNTGQFKKSDIKRKIVMSRRIFAIHQYLIINTGKQKFRVDSFMRVLKKL